MVVDRKKKKRKEREEKRKAYRQRQERLLRRWKANEISLPAIEAFNRQDYATSLNWALKGLRIDPSDGPLMETAIRCAKFMNDEATLYPLLRRCWKGGIL